MDGIQGQARSTEPAESTRISDEDLQRRYEEVQQRREQMELRQINQMRCGRWHDLIRNRGTRYSTCRLANFEATCEAQQDVVGKLTDYAADIRERVADGQGIILIGPSGTGKDHLLIGLAHAAIGNDLTVQWSSGPRLFAQARQGISAGDGSTELVRRLTDADVLIMSDPIPPSQRVTEYQADLLYEIEDRRYSNMRPTWLSVNVAGREEMESALSVAVVDRFAHGALVLACDWQSYRRKKAT